MILTPLIPLTQSKDTIWLGNKPIAQIRTVGASSTAYYILTDHLNTPRKVTNATGTVLWSWNSDAFGTTLANPDVDGDGSDFEFNLRFPGQYFDKESGQHYNYFRDYEPGTGRYLESDPIGLEGGDNTYSYLDGNSINWVDPIGLVRYGPNERIRNCRNPEWSECRRRCGKKGVDGCYVIMRIRKPHWIFGDDGKPKLVRDILEETTECNCGDDGLELECGETCQKSIVWTFVAGVGYVLLNICTLGAAGA